MFFVANFALFIFVIYGLLVSPFVFNLYTRMFSLSGESPEVVRDIMLAFAGLVGGPFVVWRSWIAYRQSRVAEQQHFTELFVKAIEQLGAEKVSSHPDGERRSPNLELRVGAIHSLGRIAQGSSHDYWPAIEVLCAYARGGTWPMDDLHARRYSRRARTKAGSGRQRVKTAKRADKMATARADIQAVIDVFGRRPRWGIRFEKRNRLRLNLTRANLRKVHFTRWYDDYVGATESSFANADFGEAALDGASLVGANLTGCRFDKTTMVGANLMGAKLAGAFFVEANLREVLLAGSDLSKVEFQACNLSDASLRECGGNQLSFMQCDLSNAGMQSTTIQDGAMFGNNCSGADFDHMTFVRSWISSNDLRGASLFGADLSRCETDLGNTNIDLADTLGDASTKLPSVVARPATWPSTEVPWALRDKVREQGHFGNIG